MYPLKKKTLDAEESRNCLTTRVDELLIKRQDNFGELTTAAMTKMEGSSYSLGGTNEYLRYAKSHATEHLTPIEKREEEEIDELESGDQEEEDSNSQYYSKIDDGDNQEMDQKIMDGNQLDFQQQQEEGWRNKKRRKWGEGTLQQCKHKNIFKNFGNILIKYFRESEDFRGKITSIFGSFEKLAFLDWLFKEVRFESKRDFLRGWLEMPSDDDQIQLFKQTLRELSHAFLSKHGLEFLRKSRMKHKEIHLRCLQPLIECAEKPFMLRHFKPENRSVEYEVLKLKNRW